MREWDRSGTTGHTYSMSMTNLIVWQTSVVKFIINPTETYSSGCLEEFIKPSDCVAKLTLLFGLDALLFYQRS